MKKWMWGLFVGGIAGLTSSIVRAENVPGTAQPPARVIDPNYSAPARYESVSGTVTVRLNGVLVDPQSITYAFAPDFRVNSGPLTKTDEGTYFMRADNVPVDQSYALTISATYDDSVKGSDGVVARPGQAYTGSIRMNVSYGDSYDFGVRFIDLR